MNRYVNRLDNGESELPKAKVVPRSDRQNTWIAVDADPAGKDGALLLQIPFDAGSSIVIVALRHAPGSGFSGVDRRAARQAVSWVGGCLAMWWQRQQERRRSTGVQGSLDQVGLPVIRLDCNAHVIGINRAARALLTCNDGLLLVGNSDGCQARR